MFGFGWASFCGVRLAIDLYNFYQTLPWRHSLCRWKIIFIAFTVSTFWASRGPAPSGGLDGRLHFLSGYFRRQSPARW
jgi:hypothetical protein